MALDISVCDQQIGCILMQNQLDKSKLCTDIGLNHWEYPGETKIAHKGDLRCHLGRLATQDCTWRAHNIRYRPTIRCSDEIWMVAATKRLKRLWLQLSQPGHKLCTMQWLGTKLWMPFSFRNNSKRQHSAGNEIPGLTITADKSRDLEEIGANFDQCLYPYFAFTAHQYPLEWVTKSLAWCPSVYSLHFLCHIFSCTH